MLERHLRLVAHQFTDFRDVGDTPGHVLEARLVRLIVGNVVAGRTAPSHRYHAVSEIVIRDLVRTANAEHLAAGAAIAGEPDEFIDVVAYVREAARLRAVAKHGDRLRGERLPDERR